MRFGLQLLYRGGSRLALAALALLWLALISQANAATCAPATSAGTASAQWQTYCWIDMTSYSNATVFGGGQPFAITLSDGSTLTFTLSGSSPNGGGITAVAAPAWSGAATGNTAFIGIPGKPILYTSTNATTVNLTLSNIQVTPPNGVVATGQYKLVVADAESTNSGESLTFTTNGGPWALVDQVPPISGSLYPTPSGTGTTTFSEAGTTGTVGAYIVGSLSPTTVTAQLQAGGLQGIMFAVQYSTISVNKTISGTRANAADQFTYGVKATSNSSNITSATSSGTGNGPFGAAVSTLSSGIAVSVYEQMAAGSVSSPSQYTTNLNCTNGTAGSPTVLPSNQPVTSFNLGSTSYGDAIACTFTNTAKPATVSLQKITSGAIGGPFTFSATNLASTPASITTTSPGTASPASPTAINASALNTAVTITETPAANFTATSATCSDANAAVTGNPASFGTLAGNVLTIPAANIVAAAQITCVLTNTVNTATAATVALQKLTQGAAGGPFTFSATNLSLTPAAITTSTAGTAYPATPSPIPVTTVGSAVTVTEAANANFTINTASCTDSNAAASGNPATSFGTLAGQVLTIPAANIRAKAQIVCIFNNIVNPAVPTVAVQKVTSTLPGGPFSFTATNLSGTLNAITTVTAGTAAPVSPTPVTITTTASAVTITEAANTSFNISTASCTDTNQAVSGNPAGSFGSLAGSVLTIPSANLKLNARIVCTFNNTPKPASVALQKITAGSFGGPFSFTATNLASNPGNITTTAAGTATPASPTAINTVAVSTAVTITEAANASFTSTTGTCSDANASFTGNPASFGSFASGVLTIPAANVLPAAQINCTITNTAKPATVAVQKITTGAAGGPFTFAVSNLSAAPASITTTAASTATPASPTAATVTALNTLVQISEGTNSFYTLSSATCTDANAAVTGNPASFGTLTGLLLAIPAANVLPAAQITCTFTNAGNAPKISLQKALAGTGRLAAADQFSLTATGTGAPAAVTTTGTGAAITSSAMNFTGTAGASYTLNEAMAAGSASLITGYSKTVACSNANPSGSNVSGLTTVPISFTAQAADSISCVITNNGTPTPNLAIVKSYSTSPSPVVVGQTITYTYVVTNMGNVAMTNVQVKDMHGSPATQIAVGGSGIKGETLTTPGPLGAAASPDTTANDGIWSTLAPGATVTFTYTHTVTQAEIDHG
ncbi:MAG: DUF11 domain-containing protein [Alphaproteobacteria bacterium]|nr:DUF11 domain-containing protein [Alphaproteobacteria bacterium]